jgi:ferrochelatase
LNFGDAKPPEAYVLVNLGSPDSPTRTDVKKFLSEFLSDPKVVDAPRWWWLPLLNIIILPIRSWRSASLYQKIWTEGGSPLKVFTENLSQKLKEKTNKNISYAMRYGSHNISEVLTTLKEEGITSVKAIPLFPQYSHTTIGTVNKEFERFCNTDKKFSVSVCQGYFSEEKAISLWSASLKNAMAAQPNSHVLFTFHGLPQRYVDEGDPYYGECLTTAIAIAEKANLQDWSLCFQSQFGPEVWLGPSTEDALMELANQKKSVILMAPGFSSDCLETLEELDINYKQLFEACGGSDYFRVACLNDSDEALQLLSQLIE